MANKIYQLTQKQGKWWCLNQITSILTKFLKNSNNRTKKMIKIWQIGELINVKVIKTKTKLILDTILFYKEGPK